MRSIKAVAAMAILASVALATGIGAALATGDDERSGRRATAVLHDATGSGSAWPSSRSGTARWW
jgi:hypothetical protein